MGPTELRRAGARAIAIYILSIIAVTVAVSVTILVLQAHRQGDQLQSALVASEYHLASSVRARSIELLLWDADRRLRLLPGGVEHRSADRATDSETVRAVHLIDRELLALEVTQGVFADPAFEAPLRRLVDQAKHFETVYADPAADPAAARRSVDALKLRLDQFIALHWSAHLARDTRAEMAAGARRFVLLSSLISGAALILIGFAVRQLISAVHVRRRAQRTQRLLQDELDHRVKNNLSAVLSLAEQTARTSVDLVEFGRTFSARIAAMARSHELLAAVGWSGIDLGEAATVTLGMHNDPELGRVEIEGKPVSLPADRATPICMILHELSTNALKHGALSSVTGRVSVTWTREGDAIDLSWVERGGPDVSPPGPSGLGTRLIEGFVQHELRGKLAMDFRPEGLVCRISVPLG